MTKKTKKAIDDPTNISFMTLLDEDKAKVIGSIAVDDGQIELGNSGSVQIKLDTVKEAELKEVMKRDRRPYTQQEIKRLFTDMLHRQYLMG